jgi:hypothetical protein
MEKREKLQLVIEQLEERIAPGVVKGNNGWGNGEQAAPGGSIDAQAKFTDDATGLTPSSSGASADFDR